MVGVHPAPRTPVLRSVSFTAALVLAACGGGSETSPDLDRAAPPATSTTSSTATTTVSTTTAPPEPGPVVIELRLERRATGGTEGFEELVRSTLTDPRGWEQAGFAFEFTGDAPHAVLLAEPAEVDATCLPYDTGGRWSCQIGPVVALNADRWREATPTWPGSLDAYRRMLVNHEVGHLLGRHHARPACDGAGPAAVMFQQSSGLDGCEANPWPLDWEIACAARHDEPVAPSYEADAEATCGPDDVAP